MERIKKFQEFESNEEFKVNEEFKIRDVSNFFKLNHLRNELKILDWDDLDYVRKLFYYIYPEYKTDKNIKNISVDNMIDILYKIAKFKTIPELYFDEKSREVKINK